MGYSSNGPDPTSTGNIDGLNSRRNGCSVENISLTKMDRRQGFHLVRIHPASKEQTALRTRYGV